MNYLKYIKLLFLSAALLVLSCSESENNSDEITRYKSELIKPKKANFTNSRGYLNPSSIAILDSTLVLIEDEVESDFITLYSLSENSVLQSFGKRGRGPGEFSYIIGDPVFNANEDLSLYDFVSKRLRKFELDKLITDPTKAPKVDYVLPPELLFAQNAAFVDDDYIIAIGGMKDGLIALVNIQNDSLIYIDPFLLDKGKYTDRTLFDLSLGEFSISARRKSVVSMSLYVPEILIIDFNGDITRRIKLENYDIDQIAQAGAEDRVIYYHDIKVTEDYIFASFIGKSSTQLGEVLGQIQATEEGNGFEPLSEVHIYDWEGNFIKKMVLEGGFYPYLSIDSRRNRIYAINHSSPSLDIVYFEPDFDIR